MEESETVEKPAARPTFLAELKRRKVFRVAATYAVVSWLIIQVASATFSDFGIPAWAFRFVVIMLLLGFPLAIILTWAFELTPDGVRKTSVAQKMGPEADQPRLDRKRNWYALGMAAALPTLIFGTLAGFFYLNNSEPATAQSSHLKTADDRPYVIGTVAVLPFTIISENGSIKTTAEGLHDEMLTTLSEMDPLNVVSRTSTLRFSDLSTGIPEIGKTLGADFVVEGSIQTVGQKIRVTLQLIQAAQDNHIWAETFDRGPEREEDLLLFQKELAFELGIRIYQALEEAYPPTPEVQQVRNGKLDTWQTQLDEAYAAFWANYKAPDWPKQHASILNIIQQIVHLDPDHPDAYDKFAGILYASTDVGAGSFYDPEWRKEFYLGLKRAYAVNPNGFDINKHLGIYYNRYENNPLKALPFSRKAVELDEELRGSVDIYTYWNLLRSLYSTGQTVAAMKIVEKAMENGLENFSGGAWFWSYAYTVNGLFEKSIALIDIQIEQADDAYIANVYRTVRARTLGFWTGNPQPIFDLANSLKEGEELPEYFNAFIAFLTEDYDTVLDLISQIQTGSSENDLNPQDLAEFRGWAYLRTGNLPMAQSYFKGFLNELENSPKGVWMQTFEPDFYAAKRAFAYACIGERENALNWVETALAHADPSRNFGDYFRTIELIAVTFGLLDEPEKASEKIDQLLSSRSGSFTGEILLDDRFKDLHDDPYFQAVIRKHADQLKDPAILDSYFAK